MEKNRKLNLILFLMLILFMIIFATGAVSACSGGGGDGGGAAVTPDVKVTVTAQEQLVVDNVNTESTEPMPITIAIDGEGPTEEDRAANIRHLEYMRDKAIVGTATVVETLPWVGGAALTIATAKLTVPAGVVIGMAYAYSTSKASGGSEDQSRGDAAIAGVSGGLPGGPVAQIVAGEAIKFLLANSPSGSSGATMGPRKGAELNPNTGQALQR